MPKLITNIWKIRHLADGIYTDIAKDVGTRFDTWNYELDRPLL